MTIGCIFHNLGWFQGVWIGIGIFYRKVLSSAVIGRKLSSKSKIINVFLHRFYFWPGFVDAQQPRPGRLSARGNRHRHREEEKDVKYHDCQVLQFMTENKWNNVPNLCVKNW